MKKREMIPLLAAAVLALAGCGAKETAKTVQESGSTVITLSGDKAACEGEGAEVAGSTVTIREAGTYTLTGTLDDGMIMVNAGGQDAIELVLDNADISSGDSAAIYVAQAGSVVITTASDSENRLSNGGAYVALDENNIDGVIFSKADLTLGGEGTLTISAAAGHGVVSKDNLVLTSGTYVIQAEEDGMQSKGDLTIEGGTIELASGDDGIHADGGLTIEDGQINISQSYEGIEGMWIQMNGGTIWLKASDDGLNAAGSDDSDRADGRMGEGEEGVFITISGGFLHIDASGDGIDSNGDLTIEGGEIYVCGPENTGNSSLDYAGEGVITGGIFAAAGSAGMAETFGSASSQGVIMALAEGGTAGSTISLTSSTGEEILSWQPDQDYTCVIISCPDLAQGETYTLTAGQTQTQITMTSLLYTEEGLGGQRGPGGPGGGPGSRSEGGQDRPEPGQEGDRGPGGSRGMGRGGMPPGEKEAPQESGTSEETGLEQTQAEG